MATTITLDAKDFFATADTHFWHDNIRRYSNRPYDSVERMNEELIKNWNNKVSPSSTVIHDGDFSFGNHTKTLSILNRLNGNIILVCGNHDEKHILKDNVLSKKFASIHDLLYISVNDNGNKQLISACHYAMETWKNSHRGSWSIHGHSHNSLITGPNMKRHDVGVDGNNYTPLSYYELKAIMDKKIFKAVDHHGRNE